jgi:hypothetical protein
LLGDLHVRKPKDHHARHFLGLCGALRNFAELFKFLSGCKKV